MSKPKAVYTQVTINMKINEAVKKQLQGIADAQGRTVPDLIREGTVLVVERYAGRWGRE